MILGGAVLLLFSLFVPAVVATGLVVALATGAGVAGRKQGVWWTQLCLGAGAVGAIGLVETNTSLGLGFDSFEVGLLAIVFGVVDVIAGTAIHRLRPQPES